MDTELEGGDLRVEREESIKQGFEKIARMSEERGANYDYHILIIPEYIDVNRDVLAEQCSTPQVYEIKSKIKEVNEKRRELGLIHLKKGSGPWVDMNDEDQEAYLELINLKIEEEGLRDQLANTKTSNDENSELTAEAKGVNEIRFYGARAKLEDLQNRYQNGKRIEEPEVEAKQSAIMESFRQKAGL